MRPKAAILLSIGAVLAVALLVLLKPAPDDRGPDTPVAWAVLQESDFRIRERVGTTQAHTTVDGVPVESGDRFIAGYQRPLTGRPLQQRQWLVHRSESKYPLIRIVEELDPVDGAVRRRSEYVADHLLVQLHADIDANIITARLADHSHWRLRQCWQRQGLALVATTAGGPDALADLRTWLEEQDDLFRSVERDAIDRLTAVPDDPRFGDMWALDNTGQNGGTAGVDIDAPEAWDLSTGSHDVLVGVLDTGVDYLHEDLQEVIWVNPGEIPDNGLDDDGNGYIDDIHGWDFVNEDNEPLDDRVGSNGAKGHGTHIAGTIAARGDNGIGVTGISWRARIVAAKALGAGGQLVRSDAIRSIHYFNSIRESGEPLVAVNHSWGGSNDDTEALSAALAAGQGLDIIHCAAAGNTGTDVDEHPFYPAALDLPNLISVAAVDRNGRLADFDFSSSNYGLESIDLAAPGRNVLNVVRSDFNGGYDIMTGTSMACPHVTGVVALAWSMAGADTAYATVRAAVVDTTRALDDLEDKVRTGGMVNARAALEALRGAAAGPYVVSLAPDRPIQRGPLHQLTIRFSADMDQGSFALADDVRAFTGPGAADIRDAILSAEWTDARSLVLTCDPQRAVGTYHLQLGTGITAAGIRLDQDRDGNAGENSQDRFVGSVSIADGAGPRITGHRPILTDDDELEGVRLFWSESMDPATFSLDLVESCTGPAGQDLRSALAAGVWSQEQRQLDLPFSTAQVMVGNYSLQLSAGVGSALDGVLLDQDGDGQGGEDADAYQAVITVTGALLPDAFGYIAQSADAIGTPLVKGDPEVQVFDYEGAFEYDGFTTHPVRGIPLGEHRFNFYGEDYDEVFMSTSFLITFTDGFSFHENSTQVVDPLQAWPREPAIAALWERWWDYEGDWDDQRMLEMLYSLLDTDANGQVDTLLVQMDFVDTTGDPAIVQVRLELDTGPQPGQIRVDYLDLDAGEQRLGQNAVVGIKDLGGQGAKRLLVAYEEPEHAWVANGKSIIYSVPASIGGRVFSDDDGDGVLDAGEVGIADQTMFLDLNDNDDHDSGEPSVVSDAGGWYSFLLPPGTYRLHVAGSAGLSTPTGRSWTLDLAAREQRSDLHVGVVGGIAPVRRGLGLIGSRAGEAIGIQALLSPGDMIVEPILNDEARVDGLDPSLQYRLDMQAFVADGDG